MTTISQSDILPLPIPLPSLIEQDKIINFISSFNQRISNEEAELAKLKKIKQGLMEDLLSGRVRTVQLGDEQE